jgi:hypothetical protein
MGSISKSFSLLLIVLLAVSSLIMAKPAFAQTPTPTFPPILTPSVPTFTLQIHDEKGTVTTTYSLNSSSGQIVATLGYNWEKTNVYVIINNQPLAYDYIGIPATDNLYFFYNIRVMEPEFSNSWTELYNFDNGGLEPSSSENQNVSIGDSYGNGTLDVQVEAVIGSFSYTQRGPVFDVYQTSGWSATQTVTSFYYVSNLSPTPTPSSQAPSTTQTSTPKVTPIATNSSSSLSFLQITNAISLIVIAFLLAVIIFLLLYMRKRKPINSSQ